MSDTDGTGGRLCGAVRLSLVGAPYRVGVGHRLDRRKHRQALRASRSIAQLPSDTPH